MRLILLYKGAFLCEMVLQLVNKSSYDHPSGTDCARNSRCHCMGTTMERGDYFPSDFSNGSSSISRRSLVIQLLIFFLFFLKQNSSLNGPLFTLFLRFQEDFGILWLEQENIQRDQLNWTKGLSNLVSFTVFN